MKNETSDVAQAYRLGVERGLKRAAQIARSVCPSSPSAVTESHMRRYQGDIIHAIEVEHAK